MTAYPLPDPNTPNDPYHIGRYDSPAYDPLPQRSDKGQGGYSTTFPGDTSQTLPPEAYKDSTPTHLRQFPNGYDYPVNQYGVIVGPAQAHKATVPTTGNSADQARINALLGQIAASGGASRGPTWYEQQQIALDKQRLADARNAQAAQEKYQHEQQLVAQSNAVEAANQSYRDLQLKSYGATANGMAYASPKGSPFAEQLPEPLLLKQSYIANHQVDPWSKGPVYGGYSGDSYVNASQPGLSNQGEPSMQIPIKGAGSSIPVPPPAKAPAPIPSMATGGMIPYSASGPSIYDIPATPPIPGYAAGTGEIPGTPGQPQLIVAHGGEQITPAPGTPMPALLGSPGGAPFSNPTDPNDPMSQGNQPDTSGGDIQAFIMNLIQAAQALVTNPAFKSLGVPMGPPSSDDTEGSPAGPPIPGMASGGVVPSYAMGGTVPSASLQAWRRAQNYSASAVMSPLGGTRATPPTMSGPPIPIHPGTPPVNIGDSPATLNPIPERFDPVMTGMSGYGATMTRNGTPVVMSNWQRSHLDPSVVTGPRGYEDYAMQVANRNPEDLKALGNSMTGNFGTDLSAPKNYAPISINPAPAGG